MARPPDRRPGHSRRRQYSLFASYVIAMAGALVGLLLVIVAAFDPTAFSALRAIGSETTRAFSAGLSGLVSGIGSIDDEVVAYWRAGSQNAALRREVEANRTRLIEADAIEQENKQLKGLLQLADSQPYQVANTRLISSSASSTRRLARLNAGSGRGIRAGMPVLAAQGLIGQVFFTSPNTADVLLITDPQNVVPVRRARDNIAAFCTGRADGTLEIRAPNTGSNPFHPGDIMVTSGTGGLYRPNIPVAIIVRTEGDLSIAVPLANPSRVEVVRVERPFQPALIAPPQSAPE